MKKSLKSSLLCLAGIAMLLTGCYREEMTDLQKQIDDINISSLEDQIRKMNESVVDLESLSAKLAPAVESLQATKADIEAKIKDVQTQLSTVGSATTEMQSAIISLKTQLDAVNAAIKSLNSADLDGRISDLTALLGSTEGKLSDRLTELEVKSQAFATLDQLAKIEAAVALVSSSFSDDFASALEESKDKICEWVSQSEVIKNLFNDYYTKAEIDAKLAIIDATNAAQDKEIEDLKKALASLDNKLSDALEESFGDIKKHFEKKVEDINWSLDQYLKDYLALEQRVVALNELFDVIGDYSDYKSNLIDDIIALQRILGSAQDDGTLTALVNTLKLVLTDSEGEYYKIADIIDDIAANTDTIGKQEARIQAIEDLIPSLATIEQFNSYNEELTKLKELADQNKVDIATLVERVDAIVGKWTDAVYDQIETNKNNIAALQEDVAKLKLALGENTEGEETGIYKLIADINQTIAELKISELWKNVEDINALLANCGVNGIKGLQNNLDDIDRRFKELWALIGTETLEIEGTIINAINVIYNKFDGLDAAAVRAMIKALQDDILLLKGEGWTKDLNLSALKDYVDKLKADTESNKADKTTVDAIRKDVTDIQTTLTTLITTEDVDKKLLDYLTIADAEKTYVTLARLTEFIKDYEALVGDAVNPKAGTILYRIKALEDAYTEMEGKYGTIETDFGDLEDKYGIIEDLYTASDTSRTYLEGLYDRINTLVGSGSFTDNWALDLTAAVNQLYTLVGETTTKTVADQADEIAKGIVKDLLDKILGDDKQETIDASATKIAAMIAEFNKTIDDIYGKLDDINTEIGRFKALGVKIGDKSFEYYELNKAILAVYTALQTYVSDYNDAKDVFDTFADRFDAVDELIGDGSSLSTGLDIITAINNLYALFGDLGEGNTVKSLIGDLNKTYQALIDALVGAETGEGTIGDITANNLAVLKDRIDKLGFDDIHCQIVVSPDSTITTLAGYVKHINGLYESIGAKIGTTTYTGADITTALKNMQDALGEFTQDDYKKMLDALNTAFADSTSKIENKITDKVKKVNDAIDAIIEALVGDPTKVTDIAGLVTKLTTMYNDFSAVTDGYKSTVQAVLSDLNSKYATLMGYLGTTAEIASLKDKNGKPISIAAKIKEIEDKLEDGSLISSWIRNNPEAFIERLGIFDIIGDLEDLSEALKDRSSLVAAINELVSRLSKLELVDATVLAELKKEIYGATGTVDKEKTLSALYNLLKELRNDIGTKPESWIDGKASDLYSAIQFLYTQMQALNLGDKPDSYDNVWDAISELLAAVEKMTGEGSKGLNSLLYSLSFIPASENGGMIVYSTAGGKAYGALTLDFVIKADKNFDIAKYSVSGYVKPVSTRADAGSQVQADAVSISNDILTVRFTGNSVGKLFKGVSYAMAAIVIEDEDESFTSQYIPVNFKVSTSDQPLDFTLSASGNAVVDNKNIIFYTKENGAKAFIDIIDNLGNGYTWSVFGNNDNWLKITEQGDELALTVNENDVHGPATITFTPKASENISYSFTVEEKLFNFSLGKLAYGLELSGDRITALAEQCEYDGNEISVDPGSISGSDPKFGYVSGFTVSQLEGTDSWLTVTASNDNTFKLGLTRNSGSAQRTADVTLTAADNSGKKIAFTVFQPKFQYTFTFGDAEGMLKDGNTYTAATGMAGSYTVPVTCTPGCNSISVSSDDIMFGNLSYSNGNITFNLARNTTADATGTITIKANDDNVYSDAERTASITVTQPKLIPYTFSVSSVPAGVTQTAGPVLTVAGAEASYSGITITSSPAGYKGELTISKSSGADWLTVPGTTTGLKFNMSATANTGSASRSATLTLSAGDGLSTDLVITVTQNKLHKLSIKSVSAENKLGCADLTKNEITAFYAYDKQYSGSDVVINLDGYTDTGNLKFDCTGASVTSVNSDGQLSFKLDKNTSTTEIATRTIKIYSDNPNVQPLILTFKQREMHIFDVDGHKAPTKLGNDKSSSFIVDNNFDFQAINYQISSTGNYYSLGNPNGTPRISSSNGTQATISLHTASSMGKGWKSGSVTITAQSGGITVSKTFSIGKN